MKLHGRGLPRGDLTHCIFCRTPGSLPSIFLSQLLSLCKNTMTSANRRNNYLPLPPGGQPGRLPRHSIFIFTSSTFHSTSISPSFLSNPPESLSSINSIFISSPNRVYRVINRSKIANRKAYIKAKIMLALLIVPTLLCSLLQILFRSTHLTTIGLIMVISTRAEIDVIVCLVLKSYYLTISIISHRARLPRRQEETKAYPNESSCQRHFKTMEAIVQQTHHLIALIWAIRIRRACEIRIF